MGSFSVARPTVQPIEQPDVLNNFAKLQAIRGQQEQMREQQQAAPFQQQQLEQQTQGGALQLQQQQQALKDQQAMTAAMHQWDGKSLDDLPSLVLKNGGSSTAVMGLKQQALAQKEKYSTIAKDDAATGASNIKTLGEKNGMIAGKLSSLEQVPDEQLGQAITQGAQELVQQGLLDPQHAQTAAQLAQLPPAQARQALENMRKGLLSDSQLLEDAQKQQEIDAKKQQAKFYAENGGAPGVSAEMIQQADWLKKNPGKGPSDYKLWTLKNSPSAMVLGNQLNGQGNSDALDFAAQNYRMTGQLPGGFTRSPGTTSAIIQRAAQLDQAEGGQGIATNKTILNANKSSLQNLQKNFDQVSAFENTASKNLDLFLNKLNDIPDLRAKFANVPMRMINDKMIGTANYQAMKAAQQTAAAETAKVLSSANASGVLSDTQKKEAEDMLSGNLSYAAAQKVVQTLKQDFANRHQSYQQQIGDIQGRIKGGNTQGGSQNQQSNPNDPFAQFGGAAHQ